MKQENKIQSGKRDAMSSKRSLASWSIDVPVPASPAAKWTAMRTLLLPSCLLSQVSSVNSLSNSAGYSSLKRSVASPTTPRASSRLFTCCTRFLCACNTAPVSLGFRKRTRRPIRLRPRPREARTTEVYSSTVTLEISLFHYSRCDSLTSHSLSKQKTKRELACETQALRVGVCEERRGRSQGVSSSNSVRSIFRAWSTALLVRECLRPFSRSWTFFQAEQSSRRSRWKRKRSRRRAVSLRACSRSMRSQQRLSSRKYNTLKGALSIILTSPTRHSSVSSRSNTRSNRSECGFRQGSSSPSRISNAPTRLVSLLLVRPYRRRPGHSPSPTNSVLISSSESLALLVLSSSSMSRRHFQLLPLEARRKSLNSKEFWSGACSPSLSEGFSDSMRQQASFSELHFLQLGVSCF